MEFVDENLKGFVWKGGSANDKVRGWRKRLPKGGIDRGGRSMIESKRGQ